MLCSVGDDKWLFLFDVRASDYFVRKWNNVHRGDINTVSWNPADTHLIATGGDDCNVNVLDIRGKTANEASAKESQAKPLFRLKLHKKNITNVQWSPNEPSRNYLASCADDGIVAIWDLSSTPTVVSASDSSNAATVEKNKPLFVHTGHINGVNHFSWSGVDPWVVASIGQNLQLWRIHEFVYRRDDEILEELGVSK